MKLTVLVDWVEPKLVPAMVTCVPTRPDAGVNVEIKGVGVTVKFNPLLA